jgi:hypothetical protein
MSDGFSEQVADRLVATAKFVKRDTLSLHRHRIVICVDKMPFMSHDTNDRGSLGCSDCLLCDGTIDTFNIEHISVRSQSRRREGTRIGPTWLLEDEESNWQLPISDSLTQTLGRACHALRVSLLCFGLTYSRWGNGAFHRSQHGRKRYSLGTMVNK